MTLRETLHAHIPVLTRASTVRDAVDKMDVYQFSGLVVVDDESKPIAVLTEGDVCRAAALRDSVVGMSNEAAHLFATADPIVADPDMEIGEAFHRMVSSGLTLLPVVESDRLLGVVFRVDLMQAMMMDVAPC